MKQAGLGKRKHANNKMQLQDLTTQEPRVVESACGKSMRVQGFETQKVADKALTSLRDKGSLRPKCTLHCSVNLC